MNLPRGVAILTVSRRGRETALRIKRALEASGYHAAVYTTPKYAGEGVTVMPTDFTTFFQDIFGKVDAIVAVMAVGIVVRSAAGCLKSKREDPAVVVVDDLGRFSISLLSGHLGGANELARWVAQQIGAIPVITTASDILGKKDIDEIALEMRCEIENFSALPAVDAAIVNGGRVLVAVLKGVRHRLPDTGGLETRYFETAEEAKEAIRQFDAGAIVSPGRLNLEGVSKPFVVLRPKTLVAGVGAKREVSKEDILNALKEAARAARIPLERIDLLATSELKRDTPAIAEAAKELSLPLRFIDHATLSQIKHPDLSEPSGAVEAAVGLPGVSEQAALAAVGGQGKLVLKKLKFEGKVTVALAEGLPEK